MVPKNADFKQLNEESSSRTYPLVRQNTPDLSLHFIELLVVMLVQLALSGIDGNGNA